MTEYRSPYEQCTELCGNLDNPGLDHPCPDYADYSSRETTIDQQRIEEVLAARDLSGASILHVGVGNSQLGRRFCSRAASVDGITVSDEERDHGVGLAIPNYRVVLLNKYCREFITVIAGPYAVIVDNNLSGFACCKYHFYLMLDNYVRVLAPGGQLLTDQRGMSWTVSDPRWELSWDDLVALERKLPVRARRITDTVMALEKLAR